MNCNNAVPISMMTDVWNTGTNFEVAVQMDVTDISSAANSQLLNLLINGVSQFAVDKNGCIITACPNIWIQNTIQNGFGQNGTTPATYITGSPILNFGGTAIFPVNNTLYDLGTTTNLFRNIYQNTRTNNFPVFADYPNSGAWGIHSDEGGDTRYLTFNNGSGLETIQFGARPVAGLDEGALLISSADGFNFIGAGVTAVLNGGTVDVTIPGSTGGGSGNPLAISDEGGQLHPDVISINFVGPGVTATNVGNLVTVTVPGGSGITSVTVDGVTITGDGVGNPLSVATGILPFLSSVITTLPVTGDGGSDAVGILLSTDPGNIVITGTDGGVYAVASGAFAGVTVDGTTITGDGDSNPLVAIAQVADGLTITGNGTTNPFAAATGVYPFITTVLVDGVTVTGDGVTNPLVSPNIAVNVDNVTITGDGITNPLAAVGGKGGSGVPITALDEGVLLTTGMLSIDFVGSGVTATNVGDLVTVTIPDTSAGVNSFTGVVVDNVTVTGDGLTNPLVAIATGLNVVNVDGVTVTGDGASNPLVSIAQVADGITITGNGTTNPFAVSFPTGDTNFANTNLSFSDNRLHQLNDNVFVMLNNPGYGLLIETGRMEVGHFTSTANPGIEMTTTDDFMRLRANVINTIPTPGATNGVHFRIGDTNGKYVGFRTINNLVANTTYVLPTGDGANGQRLTTDGAGNLSWRDAGTTSGTIVATHYYYGNTQNGFVPTVNNSFFTGANYVEDDPFGLSDGTGIITIQKASRYVVEVDGSFTNTTTGEYIELRQNGTPIARTFLQDLGSDELGAAFAINYEGAFSTNDTLTLFKASPSGQYNDVMWRVRQLIDDTTFPTIVTINPEYYYGKTQAGFASTGVDTFFANANYIEEDPFGVSDNVGTLTLNQTSRYLIDVEGSMANTVSGEVIELQQNSSVVARTTLQDLGNDDTAQFGITYEGPVISGDTFAVRSNTFGVYRDFMFRVRQLIDSQTVVAVTGDTGSDTNFAENDLTFNASRTHDLNGNNFGVAHGGTNLLTITPLGQVLGSFTDANISVLQTTNGINMFSENVELRSMGPANELRFFNTGNSNYVGFEAPDLTFSTIWVLPTGDGSAGQQLTTDGNEGLTWQQGNGIYAGDGVVPNGTIAHLTGTFAISGTNHRWEFQPNGSVAINSATPARFLSAVPGNAGASISNAGGGMFFQSPQGGQPDARIGFKNQVSSNIFTQNQVGALRFGNGNGSNMPDVKPFGLNGVSVGTGLAHLIVDSYSGDLYQEPFLSNELLNTNTGIVLKHYGDTRINAASTQVSGVLPDGDWIGQQRTLVMTNATNSGFVVINNHLQGTDVTAGFGAVNDTLVLLWNGNVWVTLFSNASI